VNPRVRFAKKTLRAQRALRLIRRRYLLRHAAIAAAMRAGIAAVLKLGPKRGAVRLGAGNYGGKLGPHHFHLKELLP